METGHGLVSSDRLVKPGIEPATPSLQGQGFIHYTTAAPQYYKSILIMKQEEQKHPDHLRYHTEHTHAVKGYCCSLSLVQSGYTYLIPS